MTITAATFQKVDCCRDIFPQSFTWNALPLGDIYI
jgi:hypothetical protein